MDKTLANKIAQAKQAAIDILLNNARYGHHGDLPRTAGRGYPEPYTRDLMISSFGIAASGHPELIASLRKVLQALAQTQSVHGLIAGLADDPEDRGSSDTTPLFLIGLSVFRQLSAEPDFLEHAARRALTWMEYQSPDDGVMVAQQPTSDWRDEQSVPGYGLYVNALVYTYLRLYGEDERAALLRSRINSPVLNGEQRLGGLALPDSPHYALWAYKVHHSPRCDVVGNCLAVLSGIADRARSRSILSFIEDACAALRQRGELAMQLPPCFFPYIQPADQDWHPRYQQFNMPGDYHNGGVWPFVAAFYVAALVAASMADLAEQQLAALTAAVRPSQGGDLEYGFNEWFGAYDGLPRGQDWQTWSAAMYLYAAACVELGHTPFFDRVR